MFLAAHVQGLSEVSVGVKHTELRPAAASRSFQLRPPTGPAVRRHLTPVPAFLGSFSTAAKHLRAAGLAAQADTRDPSAEHSASASEAFSMPPRRILNPPSVWDVAQVADAFREHGIKSSHVARLYK